MCVWFDEWLDARAAGDVSREREAATTISEIPTWQSWDSPFWTQSVTDHLGSLIEAVEAGAGPIEEEILLACSWLRKTRVLDRSDRDHQMTAAAASAGLPPSVSRAMAPMMASATIASHGQRARRRRRGAGSTAT